ncbi:oligosaccharide flippase family protein [Pelosinus fermentans]|nr:oligosaccharide flippase family protein [Pelosinus fermentans]
MVIKKELSHDKRKLLGNTLAYSIIHYANYLLPLAIIPLLVRALGPEKFGLLGLAQALMTYLEIIVDFGLSITAPKEVALYRDDRNKLNTIFNSILFSKVLLAVIAFLVLSIVLFAVTKFRINFSIFLIMFGIVIAKCLSPAWFYQGLEKVQLYLFITMFFRILYAVSIFIIIKYPEDYLIAAGLQVSCLIIGETIALCIAIRSHSLRFVIPSWQDIKYVNQNGWHLFMSRITLALYTSGNTVILGFYTSELITGYYVAAERVIRAIENMIQPVINALYPYIVRNKNIKFMVKVIVMSVLISSFGTIGLIYSSDLIIMKLFGSAYFESIDILKIMSLELAIAIPSALLGVTYLVAFGKTRMFSFSNIFGVSFYFVSLLFIIPNISITKVIIISILSHLIVLLIRSFGAIQIYSEAKRCSVNGEKGVK